MSFLRAFRKPEKPPNPPDVFVKRTVLRSSIVVKFFSDFSVCTNKPIEGLASSSVNDEADQSLHVVEQDSFFSSDMGDEDALMMGLEPDDDASFLHTPPPEHLAIDVVVKLSSLLIEGVEYGLNSSVADSVHIRGAQGTEQGDDSLLISLRSGYLLLVRIWKVPRTYLGVGFNTGAAKSTSSPTLHVFRPFVVQWWSLDKCGPGEMTGSSLSCHPSGLALVSASSQSIFRIYLPESTDLGLGLKPHFNVPIDGVILHSCFAHPLRGSNTSTQILFLTVTFSEQKRLLITLFSWFVADLLVSNLNQTVLPLNNSFSFPIMVIPLSQNSSFLFVFPDEFVIITAHNIWSADYSFKKFAYDGLFPTAYYLASEMENDPSNEIQTGDEAFMASDSGVIYCINIDENEILTCREFARIGESISTFSIQLASPNPGYILEYSCDTGGAKKLHIPQTLLNTYNRTLNTDKIPYSDVKVLKDYKGWTSVIDFTLVELLHQLPHSQQKWGLTGSGKRTKLTHFQSGYSVLKLTRCYTDLRKRSHVFHFNFCGRYFIVCSLSLESKLLEFLPEKMRLGVSEEEAISEILSPFFEIELSTIYCESIRDLQIMVQYLPKGVLITDFKHSTFESFGTKVLLDVSIAGQLRAMVFSNGNKVSLDVFTINALCELSGANNSLLFQPFYRISLDPDYSCFLAYVVQSTLLLVVGFFSGRVLIQCVDVDSNSSSIFTINLNTSGTNNLDIPLIPCSFEYIPHSRTLFVGTLSGTVKTFHLNETFEPSAGKTYKLCNSAIKLYLSTQDSNFLFASSSALWVFNFYSSPTPQIVSFNERVDRNIIAIAELPTETSLFLSFAFLRDDGLIVGSVFTFITPLIKLITIGEPAKKLIYFDPANLFVVLCRSKDPLARLCFADRKYLKVLPCTQLSTRTDSSEDQLIFGSNEIPLCVHIWTILRHERVSKKLIVGSLVGSEGSLKVLDVRKKHAKDRLSMVELTELYTLWHTKPIVCLTQIGSVIFFASENAIYSTLYVVEQKRLAEIKKSVQLPSSIISFSTKDNMLLVNTMMDSAFSFEVDLTNLDDPNRILKNIYNDPIPRSLVNLFQTDKRIVAGDKLHSSVLVMDTSKPALFQNFSYQFLFIPRVFGSVKPYDSDSEVSTFEEHQKNSTESPLIVVGVNGDIVELSLFRKDDPFLRSFRDNLTSRYCLLLDSPVEELSEKLNRPFVGKVTGKGLQNIYRPFFDYEDNIGKVIDLDIDELYQVNE